MNRHQRIAVYAVHGVVLLVGMVEPSVWLLGVPFLTGPRGASG